MWFIPSRGRPAQCQALLDATVRHGMVAGGAVITDADDDSPFEYQAIRYPAGWAHLVLPPGTPGIAESIRAAYRCSPNESWYGLISDDNTVETDGFEAALVEAAGEWGIASANDLWQAREDVSVGRMHGATVFGGELVRALGWWVPDGFSHLYIDDVWETLGRHLGNWRTLMDVVTPHHHPFKTGATPDETTARVNAADIAQADRDRFAKWLEADADADLLRARTAMWAAKGLSLDLARSRSVMLATPVYRDVSPWYAAAMADTRVLLTRLGIRNELRIVAGHSIIHQVRNELAAKLLTSTHSDLIFIDADMAWNPWDVVRLLATGRPLIAGVGRKKSPKPDGDPSVWCFAGIQGTENAVRQDRAGCLEVASVGTGFMLLNRSVLEAMRPAYGERLFGYEINEDGEETSEDITFCNRWRRLGGEVWIDPSIALRHFGAAEYSGDVKCLFEYVRR
jgi:hypothetical protein